MSLGIASCVPQLTARNTCIARLPFAITALSHSNSRQAVSRQLRCKIRRTMRCSLQKGDRPFQLLQTRHECWHSTHRLIPAYRLHPSFAFRILDIFVFLNPSNVLSVERIVVGMLGKVRPQPTVFMRERHCPCHVYRKDVVVPQTAMLRYLSRRPNGSCPLSMGKVAVMQQKWP